MGKGAAICWATKIAEAGAEDALGKQIANNQPQCLLQLLRLFQAAYVLEQKEVDEIFLLGSGAVNTRICVVLVTIL